MITVCEQASDCPSDSTCEPAKATGVSLGYCSCGATSVAGAVPLMPGGYLPQGVGNGGYAYSDDDGLGSTSCVLSNFLCGAGMTASSTAPGSPWGSQIGFNLNQPMGLGPHPNPYTLPGTGITYALSNVPSQGMLLNIDAPDGTAYCAKITLGSGTIPWPAFNTKCYDSPADGVPLPQPPIAEGISFTVTTGSAPAPFDFCVTALSIAE
jgi:hypothetical protein